MGLMLAAAGTAVPDLTWLYFAVAQFPIYLLPAMLKPLARRVAPATVAVIPQTPDLRERNRCARC